MSASGERTTTEINRSFEERDVQQKAQSRGMTYIDIAKFPINPDVLKLVSPQQAQDASAIVFHKSGRKLKVAVVDPENTATQAFIETLTAQQYEAKSYLCSQSGFETIFKLYDSQLLKKKTVETREAFEEDDQTLEQTNAYLSDLQEGIEDLPAKQALNEIEIAAIKANASDIHFQPTEEGMTIRFRIDGVLHDTLKISTETAKAMVLHIKYESGIKSNITETPQDGHMSVRANNRDIDLRISTLPTPTMESVVMRILDSNKGIRSFSELGFSDSAAQIVQQALQEKNGMILVTGPTGSGKTTTLYSMLAQVNDAEKKLVTLEDPIEYHLSGVSQSQVSEKHEYNFENGLKAILRHDPDVILVGEIRTLQTAKLASEAALTGHVVMSSLHTNSAVGAITRLRNMGMEDFNIAPTINAIFAQRLVRKVCPACVQKVDLEQTPHLKEHFKRLLKTDPAFEMPTALPQASGCQACSQTGYKGQTVLCEAFVVDPTIRKMILEQKTDIEILDYLQKKYAYRTLFEDGLLKVMRGETTVEEISRVTS